MSRTAGTDSRVLWTAPARILRDIAHSSGHRAFFGKFGEFSSLIHPKNAVGVRLGDLGAQEALGQPAFG